MSSAIWKRICSLVLFSFPAGIFAAPCNGTWNGSASNLWGNSANWTPLVPPPCVPGTSSVNDTATFAGSAPFTITQNVPSVTLESLSFSSNYTINPLTPGNNAILFQSGAASSITVGLSSCTVNTPVSVLTATPLQLNINSQLTFGGNVAVSGGSLLKYLNTGTQDTAVVFSGGSNTLTVTNSQLQNINNNNFAGPIQPANFLQVQSQFSMTGTSSVLNQNTGNMSGIAANGASFEFDQNVTIGSNNTITNTNSGNIGASGTLQGGPTGAFLNFKGSLSLTGGTLNNSNSGTLLSPANSSNGAFLTIGGSLSVSSGSTFSNLNTGAIQPNTTSTGAFISFGNTVNIAGTVSNTNGAAGTVNGSGSIGALFQFGNDVTINGVTLLNENDGQIGTTNAGATGANMGFSTHPIFLSNGILKTLNKGQVNGTSTGASTSVNLSSTLPIGSQIITENSGAITNGSTGANTFFNISGNIVNILGTFLNTNDASGTVNGVFSFGAESDFFQATIGASGSIGNANNAPIGSTAAGAFGARVAVSSGLTVAGGSIGSINFNTVNGSGSTGAFIDAFGGVTNINSSGSITSINNAVIGGTASGAIGAELRFNSLSLSSAAVSSTNNNNVGSSFGASTGALINNTGGSTLTSGSQLSNENNGLITNGSTGAKVDSNSSYTLTGSSILNDNHTSGKVDGAGSIGALFKCTNLDLNSSSFLSENDALIGSTTAGAIGAEISLTGTLNVTGATLTSFNNNNVDGASSKGTLVNVAGASTINASSTVSNENDGDIGTTTLGAEGAVMTFAGGITSIAGALANINGGNVDRSGSIGSDMTISTNNTVDIPAGGSLSNENDGNVGANVTGALGSRLQFGGSFTVEGSLSNSNLGTIDKATTGALFVPTASGLSITVNNGGTASNTNSGQVKNGSKGASLLLANLTPGNIVLNGGSLLQNTNSNTVDASGSIGAFIDIANASTLNPMSSMTSSNSGAITNAGIGAQILFASTTTIDGTVSNTNNTSGSVNGLGSIGTFLQFTGENIGSSASLTNTNNAPIGSTVAGAIGAEIALNGALTGSAQTLTSTNTNTVDGVNSKGTLVTVAGAYAINAGATASNINNGNIGTTSAGAEGAVMTFSGGITSIAGALLNKNTGSSDGSASIGSDLTISTNNPVDIPTGGSFTNENHGNVGTNVTGALGSRLQFAGNFTVEGSLSNSNSGTIDKATTGALFIPTASGLTITVNNGGSASNTNSGPVKNGSKGASILLANLTPGNMVLNSGGSLQNTNSNTVDGSASIGAFIDIANPSTIDPGSNITNTNSGAITNSALGADILFENNTFINGSASNTNQLSGSVDGTGSIGAFLQSTGANIGSSQSITNTNNAPIGSTAAGAIGSEISWSGNLTASGGMLSNTNTNTVQGSGSIGTLISVGGISTINAGSSLANSNNGAITSAGIGSQILFSGTATLNGTVSNTNNSSGTVDGLASVGTSLQFSSAALGGSFTNENDASIGSIAAGATGSVATFASLTLPSGGSLLNKNIGNVNGAASFGSEINIQSPFTISANANLSNMNSGAITNSATGSSVFINGSLTVDGSLTNTNTGSVDSTSFGAIVTLASGTLSVPSGGIVTNTFITNRGALIQAPIVDVNGGIFINDDLTQSDSITVDAGGLLTGSGTFEGLSGPNTVLTNNGPPNNGGTVFPATGGVTPAIMTIVGNYIQTADGTFQVGITNPTIFSELLISGTATLDGTILLDFIDPSSLACTQLTVLDAAGGRGGTEFTNVATANAPGNLQVVVSYPTPDTVVVSFIPTMGPRCPCICPEQSYGGGFVQIIFNKVNSINSHIILEMEKMRRHFKRSSSETETIADNKDFASNPIIPSNVDKVLDYAPQQAKFAFSRRKKENQETQIENEQKDRLGNVYIAPTGRKGTIQAKKDQPKMEYWSAGGITGFDYAFSEVGLGLLADYEHIDSHVKKDWGKIKIDEIHGSFYATYARSHAPQFSAYTIFGGSYEWLNIHRNTGSMADKRVAIGKPHGYEVDALLGFEYQFYKNIEGFHIIPLANVEYIFLHIDGYKEHNAGKFTMKVEEQNAKSLRSSLGLRMNYVCQGKNIEFVPEIYGEWQREFLNKNRHIEFAPIAFSTLPCTTLTMPGSGRDIGLAGVDFLLTFFKRHGIEVQYEFEYNTLYTDNFFYLGYNVRF